MRGTRTYLVVGGMVIALFAAGCRENRPPAVPLLSGPTLGKPAATLTYTFSTTDPENQEVAYEMSWGDTSALEWSSTYASGQEVTRTHSYPDSGVYHVKVKARDTQLSETDWSDSIVVTIGFRPPNQPGKPSGPASCTTGIACTFTVKTIHPLGDSVWFQFDWGGAVGTWGGPVASGSSYQEQHVFDSAGTFSVMVRARDARDGMSPWSKPLGVTVVQSPGGPPLDLLLSAATDSTIALWWTAPSQGTPSGYNVYFRDVAAASFALIGTVSSTTSNHDPQGATGQYAVSAVYGGSELFCVDTASTVPVRTPEMTLYEINADSSRCGYGWRRNSGVAGVFPVTESVFDDSVDFYLSDLQLGHSYMPYAVVSPNKASQIDPGAAGIVPNADWRTNGFSNPLPSGQHPLPAYQPPPYPNYFIYTQIPQLPCYIACYTAGEAEKHYALIQVNAVDVHAGTAQVESWFQPVTGLRLIKH